MTVQRDPVTGQLKKGSVLNPAGKPKKKPPVKAMTLSEMRHAISLQMPELIKVIMAQALGGDMQAARILMDKAVPTLKAVQLDIGASELPMLVMNIGQQSHDRIEVVAGTHTVQTMGEGVES